MAELVLDPIAWQRRGRSRRYVGKLSGGPAGLHLEGHDPASGIDVALSVPCAEISRVRLSVSNGEQLVGEPSVVVELKGSEPILLRLVGVAPLRATSLVARLRDALAV